MLVPLGARRNHLKPWWRPSAFEFRWDGFPLRIAARSLCLLNKLMDLVRLGSSNIEKAKRSVVS